jgi:DNA-binding NtrC family response regulator
MAPWPSLVVDAALERTTIRGAPVSVERPPRQQARVIVLEDDAEFLALLVEFLTGEGFDVSTCASYECLRAALRGSSNSIVVADFWGQSHTRLSPDEKAQIRELGRQAPTILLTGRSWAAAATAEEREVACILPKPPLLEDLIAQVQHCLALISDAS